MITCLRTPPRYLCGWVEPVIGCVAIKVDQLIGSEWLETSGELSVACAEPIAVRWWGDYVTYSVHIVEAEGDYYNLQVCWD